MIRTSQKHWIDPEPEDRFDRAIEIALIGLLAFMPIAFGAVEAWSEEVVVIVAAAISICFCAKVLVRGRAALTWTWALVPALLFAAIGIVQLIALPTWLVQLVSPGTVPQKTQLLNDLLGQNAPHASTTISFYPYATRHDLRLVLAIASLFFVVLSVFRRPSQIRRLLLAITLIGAAIALVALAQNALGNGKIYWFIPSPHGTAHSGPFVNHSHYAQFMNLSIGAALALLGITLGRAFRGQHVTPALVAEYFSSPAGRRVWGLIAMVALGTATVFASLSRGGMISLMIAGTFMTLIFASTRRLKGTGWIMALVALGAFACLLYVGFDAVYERLGTLGNLNRAEGGRWQIVKDVAVAWTRFPTLGTGLGTHEVVYPMFDRSTAISVAAYAENEYAQAAEETGALGLIALLAIAAFVWYAFAQTIRKASTPLHLAAYGLGFGLVAISVHSLSDFGQHLPANALLSATFCALLLRLPRIDANTERILAVPRDQARRTRIYGSTGLVLVCIIAAWAIPGADAARRGQAHWKQAVAIERVLAARQWQGSDDEYRDLLQHASIAHDLQAENVNYGHWLNTYRWRAISRLADPNTGTLPQSPQIDEWVNRITSDLKHTLSLCPTFGPAWCVLGQLEASQPGCNEIAVRHIEIGRALAPCHPTVCFVAGLAHMNRGDLDAALVDWDRAVALDDSLFTEVASLLITTWGRADLALQLAGQEIDRLTDLAAVLEAAEGSTSAKTTWDQIAGLLEDRCREPDAPAPAFAGLASLYRRDGRVREAVQYYRQALALDYSQVDWRLSLASLLADLGASREAVEQAKICLRYRPGYDAAKRLIDRLSLDSQPTERTGPLP